MYPHLWDYDPACAGGVRRGERLLKEDVCLQLKQRSVDRQELGIAHLHKGAKRGKGVGGGGRRKGQSLRLLWG